MMSLEALALCAALLGAGETVLLDFSAPWCGPCRSMAPTIERLAADGYPIRKVDIDRNRQLAAQYGVRAVPCFVMLADGREVGRIEGVATQARLVELFEKARFARAGRETGLVAAPSREDSHQAAPPGRASGASSGAADDRRQPASSGLGPPVQARTLPAVVGAAGSTDAMGGAAERARRATVRLRIDDSRGHSYGTGTIIDSHGDEALVVTCGHIFRESGGQGAIAVDLFGSQAARTLPGQLIHYDLQRDIGLISICPGAEVMPVPVAPPGYPVGRGDQVFSVGCDRGGQPAVQMSRITAVDRYVGAPNVEVAGQPVDGRSGGGLFSSEGFLIGICNAADPADDEGIYGALASVHQQLDFIGQRRIFEAGVRTPVATAGPSTQDDPSRLARDDPPGRCDIPPAEQRRSPRDTTAAGAERRRSSQEPQPISSDAASPGLDPAAGTEVICIVRSRNDPSARSWVVVLEHPSSDLLDRLDQESRRQIRTALEASAGAAGAAAIASRPLGGGQGSSGDRIVRGQSADE